MEQPVHTCLAGCGKVITWQFAICSDCEKKYGSSPLEWPAWLRFLWITTQKERRLEKKRQRYEVIAGLGDTYEIANSLHSFYFN